MAMRSTPWVALRVVTLAATLVAIGSAIDQLSQGGLRDWWWPVGAGGVAAAAEGVNHWLAWLRRRERRAAGMSVPELKQVSEAKTAHDFRAYIAKVMRENAQVRGYFPNLVDPDAALEHLMAGPALEEARQFPSYFAVQRVALERARTASEWKTAVRRFHTSLGDDPKVAETELAKVLTWVYTGVIALTLTVFLKTAISELVGGPTAVLSALVLIPAAAAAVGALLRLTRTAARVVASLVIVGALFTSSDVTAKTSGGGVLGTSFSCAVGVFLVAVMGSNTLPLFRILGRLLAHPMRAWEQLLQEPLTRQLYKIARSPLPDPDLTLESRTFSLQSKTPLMRWLTQVEEKVIVSRLTQVINDHLGAERDHLLVEQHSEGLKRLHDPDLIVPTRSRLQVERTLDRMDGGSIAVAGPRGSGKSTLLRQFCEPTRPARLSVFVSAPAEYNPQEFLVEFFLQVCEAYLKHRGLAPSPRMGGWSIRRHRRLGYLMRRTINVFLRVAISVAMFSLVVWSIRQTLTPTVQHARDLGEGILDWGASIGRWFWNEWRGFSQIILCLAALFLFPKAALWRFLRRFWQPEAVHEARSYWRRLRLEKTTTAGISAAISALTLTGGTSLKEQPWTLPQLVGDLRRFLEKIAAGEAARNQSVVVCIDEVDRIGSLDQAARFLSEIKAIFGIANCSFIVSVADEVGSTFARRAVAGRSIFENAFDDLVTIEPLSLGEAKDLLQVRVGGFTETFVFLAHTLSGGLPRELIRVTRHMVELNTEQPLNPRVGVLAELLVRVELRELISGTRSRLGDCGPDNAYDPIFTAMRECLADLQDASAVAPVARKLRSLSLPVPSVPETDAKARQAIDEMAAFADFSLAIIQAFASFDLACVKELNDQGTPGSYTALAAARQELSLSPASSRRILAVFRAHNHLPE